MGKSRSTQLQLDSLEEEFDLPSMSIERVGHIRGSGISIE